MLKQALSEWGRPQSVSNPVLRSRRALAGGAAAFADSSRWPHFSL